MSIKPNPYLMARLQGIQQSLVAHYAGGAAMPSASKGSEREVFVRDFLQAVFPPPFRFGSGAVTDSDGNCSGQIDVVVEYPFLPSFPMPGGADRLYLAESVAVALEVKSNLSSQWGEVERSTLSLRKVQRRWSGSTKLRRSGIAFGGPSVTAVPYIAVGYTGYKELASLERRVQETSEDARPAGALVIDSGVFVGSGFTAFGALGLYAFCMAVSGFVRSVTSAETDLAAYAS
jgi:hypothetical protein